MVIKINRAARQFVTKDAIANGVDLLNVVCKKDDLVKEQAIEISRLFKSIKILGPDRQAEEILMEIPNRKVIRDILIQKSKDGWKTENGRKDTLSFKYLMKRKEKRAFGGGENLITDEWVEPI